MCGIAGIISSQGVEAAALQRMLGAMYHRGPDGGGIYAAGHGWHDDRVAPAGPSRVLLGNRRLSIIDLSDAGRQPMSNENGDIWVTFNGEIYNFEALRQSLQTRGHRFRSRTDTEVVVHAYEEWGSQCVRHLRGMFAFAIADLRLLSSAEDARPGGWLLLARDRCGIKPLYYARGRGQLLFASEVRALLASGLVPRTIAPETLSGYLLFGSVSEPDTLVAGVASLPPGHILFVPLGEPDQDVSAQSYWEVAHPPTRDDPAVDPRDVSDRLRGILRESVRLHLVADVPLGVFLSSGIDSTALAGLAAGFREDLETFTVAFDEREWSEAALARQTARQLGTRHEEIVLTADTLLERLDTAVAALDQPSMDGINTYFVSWAARQAGLKVALSGLGGDEAFGGYSTFRTTPYLHRAAAWGRRVPRPLRTVAGAMLAAAGNSLGRGDAARKLAAAWSHPDSLPHPYFFTRTVFSPSQVGSWVDGAAGPLAATAGWARLTEAAERVRHLDAFGATSALEIGSYLVNTLLRDTDAMSMAHSLEVRVPYLDHHLLEFVAALPEAQKWGRGRPKALLIEAARTQLPDAVIAQPKRTFTFPWPQWLRSTLRARLAAEFADPAAALAPHLRAEAFSETWEGFLTGRTSWSRPWSLFVLSRWCRGNLDVHPGR